MVRLAILAALGLGLAAEAAEEKDPLKAMEAVAGKWVDLRTEASRLDADWATQKPLLESFVAALRDRAATLETRRDFLVASSARDTEEIRGLDAANRTGLAATQEAEARVSALARQLIELRPGLPPRLSAALEMSYRSLAKTDASVNERMQVALTVVTRCLAFNRDINYAQEMLTVPGLDGERLLEVVYCGMGQGYALDRSAHRAWVGRPGAAGWAWEAQPEAVAGLEKLIAVVQSKADPVFVALPATVNVAR